MTQQSTHVDPSVLSLELLQHLRRCDPGIEAVDFVRWPYGASADTLPELQILIAESVIEGRKIVHYLTAGASVILDQPGYGLEFCLQSKARCDLNVELLAMVAYMHSKSEHRLSVGHTMNIGRPIEPNSQLDRLLVSLPYPYGQDFEFAHFESGLHARVLWLMPICPGEERICHQLGLDAFEEILESREIDFLDNFRDCVA